MGAGGSRYPRASGEARTGRVTHHWIFEAGELGRPTLFLEELDGAAHGCFSAMRAACESTHIS